MYNIYIFFQTKNGDKMNISIKDNIISKIKDDSEEEILNTINESVENDNELVLPGLGVLLQLFWNKLNKEDQEKIVKTIKIELNKN